MRSPPIPTVVVAGAGSGTGKTTAVCALACALAERGLDVRLFKAGPDYLDPSFHRAALGRSSRNLDGWMCGVDGVRESFAAGAEGGDIAIVEGVMGLYDGRDPAGIEGSAAELAGLLRAPVLLVVDASGMARSAAALIEGFAGHLPETRVEAALLNKVGSPGHTRLIEAALADSAAAGRLPGPLRCLGGLPKRADLFLPSRHLGLIAADYAEPTRTEAGRRRWRAALASWAREHVDLDGLLELAAGARGPGAPERSPPAPVGRARIGLAWDEAFHFYYPDNLELLEACGAELLRFSPLSDRALPEELGGLYIGGGYPEVHAAALSENRAMREAVAAFAASGRPVYGECGGLMYLGERLHTEEGSFPMCGALPLSTALEGRIRSLGYREVRTLRGTPLGPAGTVFRGHEFHYSRLLEAPELEPAYRVSGRRGEAAEGWLRGATLGSYVHAHWRSCPEVAAHFVRACAGAS